MRISGRAQELCESRGGRPGLPVPNSPYGLCGRKATLKNRAEEFCEGRCGRPGVPVSNSPYGLCGPKATLNNLLELRSCESRSGRPGLLVLNSPYGFCGRKATLNLNYDRTELRSGVKIKVVVLGSPSLMVLMVYVDAKQH